MEEVPLCTSRVHFVHLEAKGLLDFEGRRGITPVAQRNLRPVIFSVESCAGKVNFCTGTGRKAFFEFFRPDSGPPPVHMLLQRKKAIHLYRPFFSPWHGLFRKKGGLVPVYVFIFPVAQAFTLLRRVLRRGCQKRPSEEAFRRQTSVVSPRVLSGPISRDIAIVSLRYPLSRDTFSAMAASPQQGAMPPWCLLLHRHISAIPHFATYRAILVRYPRKTSTKTFCDTIAESIARYEKYRYWAS